MAEEAFDDILNHPDMGEDALDTISVTPHTIKQLRTTLQDRLKGKTNDTFVSNKKSYHLLDIPEGQGLDGVVATINISETEEENAPNTFISIIKEDGKPDLKMAKDITISPRPSDAPPDDLYERINDLGYAAIVQERSDRATGAAEQDKQDMETLTGLPHISEGEVRGLIRDLQPEPREEEK